MATSGEGSRGDGQALKRRLQSMDDWDFEHLVADLWELQGWSTEVEQQSTDAGVDVRATKSSPYEQKLLIQAKRYSDENTLGGPDVQQYASLKQQEVDADQAVVVTTGRFTSAAEARAEDLNVKLIDGADLVNLIDDLDAYDIVDDYIDDEDFQADETSDDEPAARAHFDAEEGEILKQRDVSPLDDDSPTHQAEARRAIQRARSYVRINFSEAQDLGVGEADLLQDSEDQVFVDDLTQFVDQEAIKGQHEGPVLAVIDATVPDGHWKAGDVDHGYRTNESSVPGRDDWHRIALGGAAAGVLMMVFASAYSATTPPIATVLALLTTGTALVTIVATPAGLYFDSKYVSVYADSWDPNGVLYAIGVVFAWPLVIPWYFLRRWQAIGL